jgi:ribonuclease D
VLIHPLVTSTEALTALCRRWRDAPYVAVDTEFMRENSYWPDLCLVQVASPVEAAAIDPKSGLDLSALLDLLTDAPVLKVFHAGGQDVEIVYNLTGRTPWPIFDTQVAAMALGMGEQVGYTQLVEKRLGQQIDKGARFTDWARRPLDDRQIRYAIGDVTHLIELFPGLLEELRRSGRGGWLDPEMERLADPTTYRNDPDAMWRRIKPPSRRPEALGRLKALAAWREREAMDKDVPRGRIAKDETLADLASHPPRTQADLAKVRGLSSTWAANDIGRRLMAALEAAQPLSESEMPEREPRARGLTPDAALVADLLKLLLKVRAKESGVAPKLIARSEELDALAAGDRGGLALLEGWRMDAFGRDALALADGRLGFVVEKGRVRLRAVAASRSDADQDSAPA